MAMKWQLLCLVAVTLLGSFCDGQQPFWSPGKKVPGNPPVWPKPADTPEPNKPWTSPQDPTKVQQAKQTFDAPLTWKFPSDPVDAPKPSVMFQLREPVTASSVDADCREDMVLVSVKLDMFGIGQPIQPADLTLGTCAANGQDTTAVYFQSALQGCGGQLTMTGDALVYTYTLNYNPRPLGGSSIIRTTSAAVIVECHYPRNHNVSSNALNPTWIPFSAAKVSEELLYFSMKLMMDDFTNERPSYQYNLGDTINFEVIVKQYFHVPLRVFVDSCVGSAQPDPSSTPSYVFIQNHGCLLDGWLTSSASKFLPRVVDNKLQFQMEAFRFQGQDSGLIYVTCHVKATSAASPIDTENRACSYINGWKEASGSDSVCGSCNVPYGGPASGGGAGGSGGPGGAGGGGAGSIGADAGGMKKTPRWRRSLNDDSTWEAIVTLQMNIREKQPVA